MAIPVKPMNFPTVELSKVGNTGKTPGVGGIGSTPGVSGADKADFGSKLREALNDVNKEQLKADKVSDDYASGKQNDLHGTMITLAESDVKLRLAVQVRNKALEAYREIMRMGS